MNFFLFAQVMSLKKECADLKSQLEVVPRPALIAFGAQFLLFADMCFADERSRVAAAKGIRIA